MLRVVLGVVAGFIVWSILWLGSDNLLSIFSGWYGQHQTAFEAAVSNRQPFAPNSFVLIIGLIRSVVCSLISGFSAVSVAREKMKTPLMLGVLLLVFGIFVEAAFWNYVPLWYQISFLFLLIPVTFIGGINKNLHSARPVLRS